MSAHGRSGALIPERAAREGSPLSPPGRPQGEFPLGGNARRAKGVA
jgi:hypothetical protein